MSPLSSSDTGNNERAAGSLANSSWIIKDSGRTVAQTNEPTVFDNPGTVG